MSVQEQIAEFLRDDTDLMAIATGLIWTRPISRPHQSEIDDLFDGDLDPTPEAFDDFGWVLPCISISTRLDQGSYFAPSGISGNRYASFSPLIAYYAPPTDQAGSKLLKLSIMVNRILKGKWIEIDTDLWGRLVPTRELSGSVPIPEMPNSGYQAIERFALATVIDRD